MTTVNKKLIQEVESPFHSYLLFSNFSSELIKQAKMFAMLLAFDTKDYADHPDIKIIDSENLNTLGVEDIRDVINKANKIKHKVDINILLNIYQIHLKNEIIENIDYYKLNHSNQEFGC